MSVLRKQRTARIDPGVGCTDLDGQSGLSDTAVSQHHQLVQLHSSGRHGCKVYSSELYPRISDRGLDVGKAL